MREPLRDQLRLIHILEACDRIESYFPNFEIPLLNPKSIEFFGLVKNLEIIGEAAYMLTPDFKASHSDTQWNDIIRMRHLLVHGYYHISPEIVGFPTFASVICAKREQSQARMNYAQREAIPIRNS